MVVVRIPPEVNVMVAELVMLVSNVLIVELDGVSELVILVNVVGEFMTTVALGLPAEVVWTTEVVVLGSGVLGVNVGLTATNLINFPPRSKQGERVYCRVQILVTMDSSSNIKISYNPQWPLDLHRNN